MPKLDLAESAARRGDEHPGTRSPAGSHRRRTERRGVDATPEFGDGLVSKVDGQRVRLGRAPSDTSRRASSPRREEDSARPASPLRFGLTSSEDHAMLKCPYRRRPLLERPLELRTVVLSHRTGTAGGIGHDHLVECRPTASKAAVPRSVAALVHGRGRPLESFSCCQVVVAAAGLDRRALEVGSKHRLRS